MAADRPVDLTCETVTLPSCEVGDPLRVYCDNETVRQLFELTGIPFVEHDRGRECDVVDLAEWRERPSTSGG